MSGFSQGVTLLLIGGSMFGGVSLWWVPFPLVAELAGIALFEKLDAYWAERESKERAKEYAERSRAAGREAFETVAEWKAREGTTAE